VTVALRASVRRHRRARSGVASDPMATGWTLVLLHLVRF
jgi:hypothetical protein